MRMRNEYHVLQLRKCQAVNLAGLVGTMKVTAVFFLVLAVLFNTINRPPVLGTLDLTEKTVDQHVSSVERIPVLTVPILTLVTLPGLSDNDINLPLVVTGGDSGVCPSWQIYLRVVPIQQNRIATRLELFSLVYVGSTVLVLITVTLLTIVVIFSLLTCVWFVCNSLISCFSEPISNPTHFTTPIRYSFWIE